MTSTGDRPAKASSARQSGKRASRPYDAQATMALITSATMKLLSEKGFTALGVNAVAAAAGVDKKLIYYHFGGLDGVIRTLGSQLELWLGTPLQARQGELYADAVTRLLTQYSTALRGNTLVLKLLAWELSEPSQALAVLESARSSAMAGWVDALRAAAQPPPQGVDAPAINALLLAGVHYLALREQSVGSFAGLDLKNPQGMERIAKAVAFLGAKAYASAPTIESPQ